MNKMNIELLDTELAEALRGFSPLDSWQDISAARVRGAELVREIQAGLPPVPGVVIEDRKVPGPSGGSELLHIRT